MKRTLLYILLALGVNIFGQQIDKDEYLAVTKTVLSNREIRENLMKYSRFDSHPIYDTSHVIILDTLHVDEEWFFNDQYPKIIVTNFFNIKSGYVNYWLYPSEIISHGNKLRYSFKTQSLRWLDSTKYIHGEVLLKKFEGIWTIQKSNILPYEFEEPRKPREIECFEKTIPCPTSFNWPKKSQKDNPFFGDWQFLYDSLYHELFFTDDTVYSYDEFGIFAPFGLKYEENDTVLTIYSYYDSSFVKLPYQIIDKRNIRIYSNEELDYQTDSFFVPSNYYMRKIRNSEFKYSDVNCWGKKNEKYHCIIKSHDAEKYYDAFWNRLMRYKYEILGKF